MRATEQIGEPINPMVETLSAMADGSPWTAIVMDDGTFALVAVGPAAGREVERLLSAAERLIESPDIPSLVERINEEWV